MALDADPSRHNVSALDELLEWYGSCWCLRSSCLHQLTQWVCVWQHWIIIRAVEGLHRAKWYTNTSVSVLLTQSEDSTKHLIAIARALAASASPAELMAQGSAKQVLLKPLSVCSELVALAQVKHMLHDLETMYKRRRRSAKASGALPKGVCSRCNNGVCLEHDC